MNLANRLWLALVLLILLAPFPAAAWMFGARGGAAGVPSAMIKIITATTVDDAANTFMASNCPFLVNGTVPAGGGNQLTGVSSATPIAAGDEVADYGNTYLQLGTTVTAVSGTSPNITLTLSHPIHNPPASNIADAFMISPAYPTQWTWLPSATSLQPQNALSLEGAGIIAGTSNGGNQITVTAANGVAIAVGAYVTGALVSTSGAVPPTIASYSGGVITLSGNALTASGASNFTVQPTAPQILQYRNAAEGEAPAAQFTGSISGTSLTVSAVASGALAPMAPLYDTGGAIAQGTFIVSQASGATGGVGTYVVSTPQSVASEAMQTMGQVATWQDFIGPFQYNTGSPSYEPGDVFLVEPAVYAGNNNFPMLWSQPSFYCGNPVASVGSVYVTCGGAGNLNGMAVGDYVFDPSTADSSTQSPGTTGYFPGNITTTVTALYPSGSAPCTTPCFQVSAAPTYQSGAEVGYFRTYRPFINITIEGVTETLQGAPTRPVITSDGSGANNTLGHGELYIGGAGTPGIVSGLFWQNIDLTTSGYVSSTYLVDITNGLSGANTIAFSRIYGMVYGSAGQNTPNGDGIISSNYNGSDPIDHNEGALNLDNLIVFDNGGSAGILHDMYLGVAPNLTVNLTNSWVYGAVSGHLFKSRAGANNLVGDYLMGAGANTDGVGATFTGAISGTTLTVGPINGNANGAPLVVGAEVEGAGVAAGTVITECPAAGCGGGTTGDYTVSISQNVASEPMAVPNSSGNSFDADLPCGGALTIKNTILTKGQPGPGGNWPLLAYNEEVYGPLVATATASAAVGVGQTTIALSSAPSTTGVQLIEDLTNPTAVPLTNSFSISGSTLSLVNGTTVNRPGVGSGDQFGFYTDCPITGTNSYTLQNDTFAAFASTYDGWNPIAPFEIRQSANGANSALPGDSGWPISSWSIKNNLFAGFCPNLGSIGIDTGGASENQALYFSNFPWYVDGGSQWPSVSGGTVSPNITEALSELSETFSPNPKYGPSGDTSNVGAIAYLHQAMSGLARALPDMGAVD